MTGSSSRLSNSELLSVLLVVLLWGINFVPTKFALDSYSPFQLGAARFLLAAFPLVFFVPRPKIPLKWLAAYGLTQGVGQFTFLFLALNNGMSSALASVLMQTQIFFTALLAATLLGETISRSLKLGMVIAVVGLLCFVTNILTTTGVDVSSLGFVLTLAAASMWAVSNIIVRKIKGTGIPFSALSLVVWSSLISAISFSCISLIVDDPGSRWHWLDTTPMVWLSVLYLGWIGNGFAFWLWTRLLTRHPANRIAPFSLGIPVVGIFAGIFILGDQINPLQWTGAVLIMSALVFVIFSSLRTFDKLTRRYRLRQIRNWRTSTRAADPA